MECLPENIGDIPSLKILRLYSIRIKELPQKINNLKNLEVLRIEECRKLEFIPEGMMSLYSLKEFFLKGSKKLTAFPRDYISYKKYVKFELYLNQITPNTIYSNYLSNNLSELELIRKLACLITGELNLEYKIEAIDLIEKLIKEKSLGELERKEFFDLLEHKIQNENNIKVLKTILDLIDNNESVANLKQKLLTRISPFYGVMPEEVQIILEIESKIYMYNNLSEIFFRDYGSEQVDDVRIKRKIYAVEKGHIIALNASNLGYDSFSELTKSLIEIRYLDVSCNSISTLPTWLNSLSKLKMLDISYNIITKFPKFLEDHPSLPSINLSQNPLIEDVSDRILTLIAKKYVKENVKEKDAIVLAFLETKIGKSLVKCKNTDNPHTLNTAFHFKINEKGYITGLFIYDFETYKFTYFPEQIVSLKYLEELNLSENFYIDIIPDSIYKLKSLRSLNMSGNSIQKFSDSITKLENLEIINLSGNQIEQIPKSINLLKNLKKLDLSNNSIKIIPPSLGELKSLEFLDLSGNQLQKIPEILDSLNKLKEFYF